MIDNGISLDELDEEFKFDPNCIQLVNVSDDPSLAGCLVYFLKAGDSTIGTDANSTITMNGLGMGQHHAKIVVSKDCNSLSITPVNPELGRVLINGSAIKAKTDLKHKDTLTFGIKNSFKVVIPKQKQENEQLVDVQDFNKILEGRLNNDSKEAACMRKYLEET